MDTNKKLEFSEEDMIKFTEWYLEELRNDGFTPTKELLQLWKEQKPITLYYQN